MGLKIRAALPSEIAEACKQWVASYCPDGSRVSIGSTARTTRKWMWLRMHREMVASLVAERDCNVLVAVLDERPTEPLGWVCWTDAREDDGRKIPPSLHYVYVLEAARRHGLGTRLLARVPNGFVTTHETASGTALVSAQLHAEGRA